MSLKKLKSFLQSWGMPRLLQKFICMNQVSRLWEAKKSARSLNKMAALNSPTSISPIQPKVRFKFLKKSQLLLKKERRWPSLAHLVAARRQSFSLLNDFMIHNKGTCDLASRIYRNLSHRVTSNSCHLFSKSQFFSLELLRTIFCTAWTQMR